MPVNIQNPELETRQQTVMPTQASVPSQADGHAAARDSTLRWKAFVNHSKIQRTPRGEADKIWSSAIATMRLYTPRQRALRRRTRDVLSLESKFRDMSKDALTEQLMTFRESYRRNRVSKEQQTHALAAVREQARRVTGLNAYPNQVMAAEALRRQYMAEVATGEGKTLIASLAAVLLGWRGQGCHVVTVNDYLAERDAQTFRPLFESCGLTVASIKGEMNPTDRRHAYASDITYVTNKEVCADYLRDQLAMRERTQLAEVLLEAYQQGGQATDRLVMRGRAAAIVDEVDSILLDEAATPLLISGEAPNAESVEAYQVAAELADQFEAGAHYTANAEYQEIRLTKAGRQFSEKLCQDIGGIFASSRRREELISQAITAQTYFIRDEQYIIQDDKIIIIDESTGRQMPDRTWRDGLHQAVEAKEKITVNPPKATFARLSFQRFFRGYLHLCGMSGTTWEGRHEFQLIYKRATVRIPTHRPVRRQVDGTWIFRQSDQKWNKVVAKVKELHENGIPVLVGTHSVETSERLSLLLEQAEIAHVVLNAVRHEEEAEIVKHAGRAGAVTIATNMAGRGTDIHVSEDVQAKGGLYVLATNVFPSSRLDRQLIGRTSRQGQPGQAAFYVSLADPVVERYLPRLLRPVASTLASQSNRNPLLRLLVRFAQRRSEKASYTHRKHVLRQDEWLEDNIGFAPGSF